MRIHVEKSSWVSFLLFTIPPVLPFALSHRHTHTEQNRHSDTCTHTHKVSLSLSLSLSHTHTHTHTYKHKFLAVTLNLFSLHSHPCACWLFVDLKSNRWCGWPLQRQRDVLFCLESCLIIVGYVFSLFLSGAVRPPYPVRNKERERERERGREDTKEPLSHTHTQLLSLSLSLTHWSPLEWLAKQKAKSLPHPYHGVKSVSVSMADALQAMRTGTGRSDTFSLFLSFFLALIHSQHTQQLLQVSPHYQLTGSTTNHWHH